MQDGDDPPDYINVQFPGLQFKKSNRGRRPRWRVTRLSSMPGVAKDPETSDQRTLGTRGEQQSPSSVSNKGSYSLSGNEPPEITSAHTWPHPVSVHRHTIYPFTQDSQTPRPCKLLSLYVKSQDYQDQNGPLQKAFSQVSEDKLLSLTDLLSKSKLIFQKPLMCCSAKKKFYYSFQLTSKT